MYEIRKTFEFAGAHSLNLPYHSKCSEIHGHNWKVTLCFRAKELNECGMIIDFTDVNRFIENNIMDEIDHKYLNEIDGLQQPTAEGIAHYLWKKVSGFGFPCYRVEVQESRNNVAAYEEDS